MTTKVLIVNHGPDKVLVRTVCYGPDDLLTDKQPQVLLDSIVHPTEARAFWVHIGQQLLVGEKRP